MRRLFNRFLKRRWQKIVAVIVLILVLMFGAVYLWAFTDLPSIDNINAGLALPSTRIYDRHGRLLYEVIDPMGGRNVVVPLERIPQWLVQATIATEDRNFYNTPGVDLEGVIRALAINLQGGEIRAGGSTITQQVVRNLLLDPTQRAERTLRRKLREMMLALQLSARKSKDDILALYLNQTYYGNLAYGAAAAADVYFNKDISALTLAESALLAGLPQSPAVYDPLTNPEGAKTRQRVVLDLMVAAGYISAADADAASKAPLHYGSGRFPMQAPHFVQTVWARVEREYGALAYSGGLEVTTTLDLDWQLVAEEAAQRHLAYLNSTEGGKPSNDATGAALVAIDPATGQIMAMLGSPDYDNAAADGAINMAIAPRQPGSTLKPFTYALTFDPNRPDPWSPATMILDVQTPFVTRQLESYTPANYGLVEHGPVLIREALASSYNIPAVVALNHAGVDSLARLLTQLGVTTLDNPANYDLAITLGGGDIRLTELTAAYAALANGGRPIQPSTILSIRDGAGKMIYAWQQPEPAAPIIDPRVAWLLTNVLSDNEARRPAFGTHSPLVIGRPAAVKTGTTTDFRDNWTVGFTPQIVVGVWVGNPDNRAMQEVSGVTGAGPIWHDFMRSVLKDKPELPFERPGGLVQAEVCAISGLLPTQYCPKNRVEWFIRGTVPIKYDDLYQSFSIDRRTGLLADENTPPEYRVDRVYLVLPQEARTWGLRNGIQPPPVALDQVARNVSDLRVLSPEPYTVFQISPLIPRDAQRVKLSVSVPPGTRSIEYWLDDGSAKRQIGSVGAEPWWAWWTLEQGDFRIWARATLADGTVTDSETISVQVTVYIPPDERPSSGKID